MKLNEVLKQLRAAKDLNQSQMADILGISLSSYQKYERDKNSITPSLDVLLKIADFHNVSLDYLLGRETDTNDPVKQLAGRYNMTLLERQIAESYLELDSSERKRVMEFVQQCVDKSRQTKKPADNDIMEDIKKGYLPQKNTVQR